MSSSQPSGSQKLRKNGSSPSIGHKSTTGPLRATIPVSLMSQTNLIPPLPEMKTGNLLVNSPTHHQQHASNRILIPSPVMIKSNTLQHHRSRQSPWRLRQWSPIPVGKLNIKYFVNNYHSIFPIVKNFTCQCLLNFFR